MLTTLGTDINCSLNKLRNIILEAGEPMKVVIRNSQNRNNKNAWFDNECKLAKNEAKHALTRVTFAEKKEKRIKMERIQVYKEKKALHQNMIDKKEENEI